MKGKKRKNSFRHFNDDGCDGTLSKDEVIRIMKSGSKTWLQQLEKAKKSDIDNYAYLIINTKNFREKYEYLLSLSPLNVLFYQDLIEDASEECFQSYVSLVYEDFCSKIKSVNLIHTKESEVWKQVGMKYRFSLVVSLLVKMKKEKFLKIILNNYVLTPEEENLLLECYLYYDDCSFLEWYFSYFVLYPETFDQLCNTSYSNLYNLYYKANNGSVPLKYRIRRWKNKISDVFDEIFFSL